MFWRCGSKFAARVRRIKTETTKPNPHPPLAPSPAPGVRYFACGAPGIRSESVKPSLNLPLAYPIIELGILQVGYRESEPKVWSLV